MKIAVASGKGGTGKTTVATNLAHVASQDGWQVAYLDCDVEEPNGHIFLKPALGEPEPVCVLVPQVDEARCTHCGKCGEICQFGAIVCLKEKMLVYPELCHSCGGCTLVCPSDAITETPREIGQLQTGAAGGISFRQGLLNVGEPMSPPVIKAVKEDPPQATLTILDSPPGTSCPVIESLRGADFALLVTEPTPFGLNDLDLAVQMVRAMGLRFGVVINRSGRKDRPTRTYCKKNGIDVLARIPDDRRIAESYCRGEITCDIEPAYRRAYEDLLSEIESRVNGHD